MVLKEKEFQTLFYRNPKLFLGENHKVLCREIPIQTFCKPGVSLDFLTEYDNKKYYVELKVGSITHRDIGQIIVAKESLDKDRGLIWLLPSFVSHQIPKTVRDAGITLKFYDKDKIKEYAEQTKSVK